MNYLLFHLPGFKINKIIAYCKNNSFDAKIIEENYSKYCLVFVATIGRNKVFQIFGKFNNFHKLSDQTISLQYCLVTQLGSYPYEIR